MSEAAATLELELAHAFGSRCNERLQGAALFGDGAGEVLLRLLARHISFLHLPSGESSFAVEREVKSISACAISQDRGHLAVCQRCYIAPLTQVSIYDLQLDASRPAQTLQEFGGRVGRISCAAFSRAADELCLASESLFVVVNWRSNVILGRCSLSSAVDRVAFSPLDSSVVSASGPEVLQLWSVAEQRGDQELQSFAGLEGLQGPFADHGWLEPGDGTLLLCRAKGDVQIFSSHGEERTLSLVRALDSPFQMEKALPLCVRCFARGFLLGGSGGAVALWERAHGELKHVCTVSAGGQDVRCIDVSDEGEDLRVLLGFADSNIAHAPLPRDPAAFHPVVVAAGVHAAPVTSLALAVQRPVFASASQSECAVRIWNFGLRRCELLWRFPNEEPLSLALHPLGYFLAVAFADRLRFLHVLASELKLHRELPIRGVRLVSFSHGGHLLAAAQGKNVVVFASRSLAKVATLRGHSQPVASLSFSNKDGLLATCGEDGSLINWSTQSWTKLSDTGGRFEVQASVVAAGEAGQSFVGLADAGRLALRSYRDCGEEGDLQLAGGRQVKALVHHASQNMSVLFAGDADGSLWAQSLSTQAVCMESALHRGACNAVCMSGKGHTLVTAGEDGIIFVLRVQGMTEEAEEESSAQGEVVMTMRGEIESRLEEMEALSMEARQLKVQLLEDAARIEREYLERLAQGQQKDQEEMQELRLRCESLQQSATATERENLRSMKAMEASHVQAADHLEQSYDKRARHEKERYAAMEEELRRLEISLKELQLSSKQRLEQQRQRQRDERSRSLGQKDGSIQKLKDLAAFSQQRFDVMLDQDSMEQDLECSELNRQQQEALEEQRLALYQRKKEQDSLVRSLEVLEGESQRIRLEKEETKASEESLRLEAAELQRALAQVKAERRDHEGLLRDRELEMGGYKQKVRTLKKFRQILDFRLREVASTLQPQEETIQELQEKMRDLEADLERQLLSQRQMEGELQEKREQAALVAKEAERLREVLKQRERAILRFTEDLAHLATKEQDVRLWPAKIRQIHADHVFACNIAKAQDGKSMRELGRQLQLLSDKATCLEANSKQTGSSAQSDINRTLTSNSALIQEADSLRVEKKALESQLKELEFQVGRLEKRLRGQSAPALPSRPGSAARQKPERPATPLRKLEALAVAKGKAKLPHKTAEERLKVKKLLAEADRSSSAVHLHAIETKLLRDHLQKLQTEAA